MNLACNYCGGVMPLSGKFDFLNGVAFLFDGSTIRELEDFRRIAQAAASGNITHEQAAKEAGELNKTFASWLSVALKLGMPGLLVAIIALYIQIKSAQDGEISNAKILEELHRQAQTNVMILQELQTMSSMQSAGPPPMQIVPTQPTIHIAPSGHVYKNRADRRRDARAARKAAKYNASRHRQ